MDVYDSIKVILFKNFKVSLEEAVFPEKLKSTNVIQVFEKGEHTILQFTRVVAQNFDNGKFTLGVFIDPSKGFIQSITKCS